MVEWLRSWDQGNPWCGPGGAPDQDGSLVPLDVLIRWKAEKNVIAQRQAKDAALLDKILTATGGNFERTAALPDLRPIHVMLASEIPLDRILTVIRGKHDRRCDAGVRKPAHNRTSKIRSDSTTAAGDVSWGEDL
jgi:hypothetical protein